MADYKLRSLDTGMGTGGRTTVRLDDATWAAVDLIAGRKGVKWREWARDLLKANPDAPNATAVIRNAAVNELMTTAFIDDGEERGFDLALQEAHALMKINAAVSNAQLDEMLKVATVQGRQDFGGFEIAFGHDNDGRDCVWVINGLKNGLNFVMASEK